MTFSRASFTWTTRIRSVTSARSLLELAAQGRLPGWAEATEKRREHMARVATLMDDWATRLGLDETERTRWRAAAWLHDALRDAPANRLRPWLSDEFRGLPDAYLHGPATAERLSAEGVQDLEVLDAIRYHTLASVGLGVMGRSLIAADFLEPGRPDRAHWRASLRDRMPLELDAVLREVVAAKLQRDIDGVEPMRPEMVSLWNSLVSDGEDGSS
jgi:HD superfamily phosphohydrolase YqeK